MLSRAEMNGMYSVSIPPKERAKLNKYMKQLGFKKSGEGEIIDYVTPWTPLKLAFLLFPQKYECHDYHCSQSNEESVFYLSFDCQYNLDKHIEICHPNGVEKFATIPVPGLIFNYPFPRAKEFKIVKGKK